MSFSWYLQRIKTFSAGEVIYRIRQRIRTHILDALQKDDMGARLSVPNSSIVDNPDAHLYYPIFEGKLDIFKDIDWHLDLSTGKRFPQAFAHKIDIRSDRFGSAKHVWEVNRLQFLLHIAMLYRKSGELKYLVLFCHHVGKWKNANPYMIGVNWYSNIEVNLRLICWYFCWQVLDIDNLHKTDSAVEEFLTEAWWPTIREHAEYSYNHPSLCSSANNHLISEYAGLFLAACRWKKLPHRNLRLKYAQKGLEREILRQNTPEGVNREEAAEYIQFIDDFFLIAAVVGDATGHPFSEAYKNRLHAMARYMNAMLDVNCNYPMYGDGDDGFVLRPDAGGHFNNFRSLLVSFATYFEDSSFKREGLAWDEKNEVLFGQEGREKFEALPVAPHSSLDGNRFFTESGHFIFRKVECSPENAGGGVRETYLHFDAAPLGFLSIAAHGHADALSFILHVDGSPVLVDPGTFTYHTHKDLRRYFVSTLAHNTVCVNGMNQAKQAGPTMWLNHYHCRALDVDEDSVEAIHDGYVAEGVLHRRRVRFDRGANEFTVTDTLECELPATVEIPFHLHPAVTAELQGAVALLKVGGVPKVQIALDEMLSYAIREDGWYSEHFGEKVPARFLYAKTECTGSMKFVTRLKVL